MEDSQEPIKTVCGGTVKDALNTPSEAYQGRLIYFCTEACRRAFLGDPERFLAGEIEHPDEPDEPHQAVQGTLYLP